MATSSLKGMDADPSVVGVKKTDLFRVCSMRKLVRVGTVTADAAIEAIREHRENVGPFLLGKLEEAKGQAKAKVTRRKLAEFEGQLEGNRG